VPPRLVGPVVATTTAGLFAEAVVLAAVMLAAVVLASVVGRVTLTPVVGATVARTVGAAVTFTVALVGAAVGALVGARVMGLPMTGKPKTYALTWAPVPASKQTVSLVSVVFKLTWPAGYR
jgi:hypothetical protein